MRTALRILAVGASLWALTATASAETFCVHSNVDCDGTAAATLQAALSMANSNGAGTRDTIQLPAGTFKDGPATDVPGNPVDIVGLNEHDTWLEAATNNSFVLNIMEPTSTVSKLRVNITGTGNEMGIALAGKLDQASVWSLGGQTNVTAVQTYGGSAAITNSKIIVRDYTAAQSSADAVYVASGSYATITDSRLVGRTAVDVQSGSAALERDSLNAHVGVTVGYDGYASLRDSTILTPGPGQSNIEHTGLGTYGTGTDIIDALQVSIYDYQGLGTGAFVDPAVGGAALISLTDSVVAGYPKAANVIAGGTLNTIWSAYDFGKIAGGGAHNHANDLDLAGRSPGFYSPAADSFDLRNDSPLIDAGDPNASTSGLYDRRGLERYRDGNGDGTTRVDIGAMEYQRAAPTVSATADLTTANPGQLVSFGATIDDVDRADVLTKQWSFDDGTITSGDSVQHAFATPGVHRATITATDSTGLASSATVDVTVPGPTSDPAASQPAPAAGPSPKPAAPLLTKVRLTPARFRPLGTKSHGATKRVHAGSKLTFNLSQDTTVKVVIERRKGKRWVRSGSLAAKRSAGHGSLAITGRVHGRPLSAGSYRLNIVARNAAGVTSARSTVRFAIVR